MRAALVSETFIVGTEVSVPGRWVYVCLCMFAGDDGWCWPSLATLVTTARIERRRLLRLLDELEAAGHVKRLGGGGRGRPTCYYLPARVIAWPPIAWAKGGQGDHRFEGQAANGKGGQTARRKGGRPYHQNILVREHQGHGPRKRDPPGEAAGLCGSSQAVARDSEAV